MTRGRCDGETGGVGVRAFGCGDDGADVVRTGGVAGCGGDGDFVGAAAAAAVGVDGVGVDGVGVVCIASRSRFMRIGRVPELSRPRSCSSLRICTTFRRATFMADGSCETDGGVRWRGAVAGCVCGMGRCRNVVGKFLNI